LLFLFTPVLFEALAMPGI